MVAVALTRNENPRYFSAEGRGKRAGEREWLQLQRMRVPSKLAKLRPTGEEGWRETAALSSHKAPVIDRELVGNFERVGLEQLYCQLLSQHDVARQQGCPRA